MPERHVGTSLGRFRIDALIGSGGFAWVYKGYDPELDIPVAIKVLKPQFAGDETFESRFRREASTAAKLRHPNIVRILAVGRQGQDVYFVMDFLPHGLVDRLRVMGTFPDNLIICLGLDVSAALAFAHREGVIHRDIKTDNILFDDHGNAVVADFGIARAVSGYTNQTGTNMVVGTPQYFSPEQARGLALDGRADIYSLGVTLYKAATGVLPFQGDDWYEIARQHVEDEPPRPRSFNPAISREVERLILRCLEKDAELRYNTADALRADLMQLQAQSGDNTGQRTIMMATPRDSDTMEIGLWPAVKRRIGSRPVRVAFFGAVMALVLVASLSRGLGNGSRTKQSRTNGTGERPILPAPKADSVAVTTPDPPPDTVARVRPAGRLVISAPSDAIISLNGVTVGRGSWRSDSVTPGPYVVSAQITSISGCSADRHVIRVVMPDGAVTSRVTLSPKGCGRLMLDAQPARGHYVLSPVGSRGATELRGPLSDETVSLVVPAGNYRLTVSAPYCADFRGDITIERVKERSERVRLICQ